jgi:hypothetical protein
MSEGTIEIMGILQPVGCRILDQGTIIGMEDESLSPLEVAIIGSDAFQQAIKAKSKLLQPAPDPGAISAADAPTISVDARGNVVGDTSGIDPHILEQLQSPASQKQIREMYRQSRYPQDQPRETVYIAKGVTRDLRQHQIIPGRIGRRLRRQYLRKVSKINAKGESHGRHIADQSDAGNGTASL